MAYPGQDRRIGDLVAVQLQNWQHRPVIGRVEKLVGMPGGGQRAGLGFTVADHAAGDQIRIIEHSAIGMRDHITQFAAFMN